jgi:uncharacterized membrane protein (GlpM family)
MSRQLVFSSMISVVVLATFALSSTTKAYAAAGFIPVAQIVTVGGR